MSIVVDSLGTGSSADETYTSNLTGWWPFFDLTGSDIADKSGNGHTLSPYSGAVSNINGSAPGRGQWVATGVFLGKGDTTALELIGANTSFILHFRVNISADIDGGSGYLLSKVDGPDRDDGWGFFMPGTTGVGYVRAISGASQVAMSTDLRDGADHSIMYFLDRGTDTQGFYLDGSDDTGGGATPLPAYTTATTDGDFTIGGSGESGDLGNHAAQLTASVGTDSVEIWDVQLYLVSGNLPASATLDDFAAYLSTRPYSPLPSRLW